MFSSAFLQVTAGGLCFLFAGVAHYSKIIEGAEDNALFDEVRVISENFLPTTWRCQVFIFQYSRQVVTGWGQQQKTTSSLVKWQLCHS